MVLNTLEAQTESQLITTQAVDICELCYKPWTSEYHVKKFDENDMYDEYCTTSIIDLSGYNLVPELEAIQ
tara:strand:+ start:203 stop:412 length:210 start_codon:yes stop_codon:yes gene_type:complete